MADYCQSCKERALIVAVDTVGRDVCTNCAPSSEAFYEAGLAYLRETIPFQIGDRVECRTAGVLFDGTGYIDAISNDLEYGGTPVYPSFHVVIENRAYDEAPEDAWYCESQLTHAEKQEV